MTGVKQAAAALALSLALTSCATVNHPISRRTNRLAWACFAADVATTILFVENEGNPFLANDAGLAITSGAQVAIVYRAPGWTVKSATALHCGAAVWNLAK